MGLLVSACSTISENAGKRTGYGAGIGAAVGAAAGAIIGKRGKKTEQTTWVSHCSWSNATDNTNTKNTDTKKKASLNSL